MDSKIRQVRELFSELVCKLTGVHRTHNQTLFINRKGDFQCTGENEGTRRAKPIFKKKQQQLDKFYIIKDI